MQLNPLRISIMLCCLTLASCTQEIPNKFSRAVQNWTGTDGVLEVYAGEKLVKRFVDILPTSLQDYQIYISSSGIVEASRATTRSAKVNGK